MVNRVRLLNKYKYLAYQEAGNATSHMMFKVDPATDIVDLYQVGVTGIWERILKNTYDKSKGSKIEVYYRMAARIAIKNYLTTKAQRVKYPTRWVNEGIKKPFLIFSLDGLASEEETFSHALVANDNVELDVGRIQMIEHINDALWELEDSDRELLEMTFGLNDVDQHSQRELSDYYNVSVSIINKRLQKAMQAFNNVIQDYVTEDEIDDYIS